MLYLEDYLEMIEHLPQELRDRFTEMRELDLTVQNNMDSLEKKTRSFFLQCKRGELQDAAAEAEYQNLRKEYYKVLEDADEKVAIATQIHELVERYLRRLDSELFKFKCELEADNNGITEILEARSLAKKDGNPTVGTSLMNVIGLNQKENRYYGAISPGSVVNNHAGMIIASGGMAGHTIASPSVGQIKDNRYRTPKPEKRRNSTSAMTTLPEKRPNLSSTLPPAPLANSVVRPLTPSVGAHTHGTLSATTSTVATPTNAATVAYNLQHMGASASNAIAVAASQAIVATQQMQHGRRTASLKASYEAIHGSTGGPTEFWISRDITNAASTVPQTTIPSVGSEKKQKKKLNTCLSHTGSVLQGAVLSPSLTLAPSTPTVNATDAIDMLPPPSNTTAIAFSSLGLNSIGSSGALMSSNSSRSTVATVSASATTNAVSTTASNFNENGLVLEQTTEGEWSYDPNEPRYCTCNQVSYGDMVACDNDACPYEWFHYPCVGITQPPKGKWYCPKCTASMRRRGNRKNL